MENRANIQIDTKRGTMTYDHDSFSKNVRFTPRSIAVIVMVNSHGQKKQMSQLKMKIEHLCIVKYHFLKNGGIYRMIL